MDQNLQPVLLNAQEAYMQSTTNKYKVARKHLKNVIIKINNAIEKGSYSIDVEGGSLTDVDIEYLEYHGYKFIKTGKFFDMISWKLEDEMNK